MKTELNSFFFNLNWFSVIQSVSSEHFTYLRQESMEYIKQAAEKTMNNVKIITR